MRVVLFLTVLLALSALVAESRMLRVSKQKISRGLSRVSRAKVDHTAKLCGTGWGSFNQYDPAWKAELIGTKTIGAVGCAMTSVTNGLKSRVDKITVGGAEVDVNPANVNKFLKEHNGYDGNLIKWAAIGTAGLTVHMIYNRNINSPTFAELKTEIEGCKAVILNVRNGGHWVLATAAAADDKFDVKDPGFDSTSYGIADVKRAIIYDFKEDAAAATQVQAEGAAAAAPPAEEAAVAPPAVAAPPEGEAAAATEAAENNDAQTEVTLVQADIDALLAKNGGDFGGDGAPGLQDAAGLPVAVAQADAAAAPAPGA